MGPDMVFEKDPQNRPNIDQIIAHPYFSDMGYNMIQISRGSHTSVLEVMDSRQALSKLSEKFADAAKLKSDLDSDARKLPKSEDQIFDGFEWYSSDLWPLYQD